MDLNDLRYLDICEKCSCVYMPEYEEDYDGRHKKYWDRLCSKCRKEKEQGK